MPRPYSTRRGAHLLKQPRGYRPSLTMREHVLERDKRICQVCGATEHVEVAHIIPWPGGPTDASNLRVLCRSCNHRERRRWGANAGQPVPAHPVDDTALRAIMERALV